MAQASKLWPPSRHPLIVSEAYWRHAEEQFIATQNLQVLQQSQHFKTLLPPGATKQKQKKSTAASTAASSAAAAAAAAAALAQQALSTSKITALLTLPTRPATRYDITTPSTTYGDQYAAPVYDTDAVGGPAVPHGQLPPYYIVDPDYAAPPNSYEHSYQTYDSATAAAIHSGQRHAQSLMLFQDSSVLSQQQLQQQQLYPGFAHGGSGDGSVGGGADGGGGGGAGGVDSRSASPQQLYQPSLSISLPPGATHSSFSSDVVDGLRGSLTEGEYISPPPALLSSVAPSVAGGGPLTGAAVGQAPPTWRSFSPAPSHGSHPSAAIGLRPPPLLQLSLSPSSVKRKKHLHLTDDSLDSSTVASSAASSASSGLNEQGSHLIYRAYSSQVAPPRSDLLAVGDAMTISPGKHGGQQHAHAHYPRGDPPDASGDAMVSQSQSQPLKRVVISKGTQNLPPYQSLNRSLSAVSQTSGHLMNLSLSNGSLQSGSLALLTERAGSLSRIPHRTALPVPSSSSQKAASLAATSSAPSLMILAPKTAEALATMQQQQQQQRQRSSHGKQHQQLSSSMPLRRPMSPATLTLPPVAIAPSQTMPTQQQQQLPSNDSVKPHRRLRSISGRDDPVTHRVWVGRQGYKAATAKVTVNPGFRLPTMVAYEKRAQEQQQWQQALQQAQAQAAHPTPTMAPYAATNEERGRQVASREGRVVMTMTDLFPAAS